MLARGTKIVQAHAQASQKILEMAAAAKGGSLLPLIVQNNSLGLGGYGSSIRIIKESEIEGLSSHQLSLVGYSAIQYGVRSRLFWGEYQQKWIELISNYLDANERDQLKKDLFDVVGGTQLFEQTEFARKEFLETSKPVFGYFFESFKNITEALDTGDYEVFRNLQTNLSKDKAMMDFAYTDILTSPDPRPWLKLASGVLAKDFEPGSYEQNIFFPVFGVLSSSLTGDENLTYSTILQALLISLKPNLYSADLMGQLSKGLEHASHTDSPDLDSIFRAKILLKNPEFSGQEEVQKLDQELGDALIAAYQICPKTFVIDGGQKLLKMLVDETGEEGVREVEELVRSGLISTELGGDFYKFLLAKYGGNTVFEQQLNKLVAQGYAMDELDVKNDIYLSRPL